MKKITVLFLAVMISSTALRSQTLFTYGAKTVSKDEFIKAFNKNPDSSGSRNEKIKEYLDLYINFKLKIQAAADEKLSGNASYKYEADNFKSQLTENYINEQANINGLIHEAFERSQKDILLQQVFVEVKQGGDTTEAYKQIKEAYNELQSGKDFSDVATSFAKDEPEKKAKGMIGYITAFSLPYQIETLVYNLKPGLYSGIYKSNIGYHIFKNVSERPAVGKRKIQQILFAVPDSFSPEEKASVGKLSDSVYQLLQNGASFEKMTQQYSAPNNNYDPSNVIEVGVGQYNSDFEKQIFALNKPGEISKPFETAYGYNILKLVEATPVNKDTADVVNKAHLQEQVERDNRLALAKDALIQKWMQETKYTAASYNSKDLWSYTDSSLKKGKALSLYKNITPQTLLFSFAKEKIIAADWVQHVQDINQATPYGPRNYDDQMKQYIKLSCDKYYRKHIEDYYPPIAGQLKEFNEANLLFSVMDKHVWSKAAEDTVGLKNYYNLHKKQYTWQPGVSALVLSSASKEMIDSVAVHLKNDVSNWRNIVSLYSATVMADSSRFEDGQLPLQQQVPMQKGFMSAPEQNESGDAYTMVYVFDVFAEPAQRNFEDAKGMVINDYQQVLEQKWIAELKKKYPVKVNDAIAKNL